MILSDSLSQNFTGERPVLQNDGKENPLCGDQKACELFKSFEDTIFSIFQSLGHSATEEKRVLPEKEVAFGEGVENGQDIKLNGHLGKEAYFPSSETKEMTNGRENFENPIGAQGLELPSLSQLHRLVRIDQGQEQDGTSNLNRELKNCEESGVGRLSVTRLAEDSPSTAAVLDEKVELTIDDGENVPISETKGPMQKKYDEEKKISSSTLEAGSPPGKPILAREPSRNSFVQHTEEATLVSGETSDKGNPKTEERLFEQEMKVDSGVESSSTDKKNGKPALSQEEPAKNNKIDERQSLSPFTPEDVEVLRQSPGQPNEKGILSSFGRDPDLLKPEATMPTQSAIGGASTGHLKNSVGEERKEVNPAEKGKPLSMERHGEQQQAEPKSPLQSTPRSDFIPHFENSDKSTQQNAESNPKVLPAGGISTDMVAARQPYDRTETSEARSPQPNVESRDIESKLVNRIRPVKNVPVAEMSPSEEANPLEKAVSDGKGKQNETPEILKSSFQRIHHEPVSEGNKIGTSVFPEIDRDLRYSQTSGSKPGASVQSANSFLDGSNRETTGIRSAEIVEAATPGRTKNQFSPIDAASEENTRDLTKDPENAIRMKTVNGQQQSNDHEAIVPEHRYRGMTAEKESADGHKQMPSLSVERKAADQSENQILSKKQAATEKNDQFKTADAEKVSEPKAAFHDTDNRFRGKQRDLKSSKIFNNSEAVKVREEGSSFSPQAAGAKKEDNLSTSAFQSNSTKENNLGEKLPPASFTPVDEPEAKTNRTFESISETDKFQHAGKEASIHASPDPVNKPTVAEASSVTKPEQFLPDNLKSSVLDQLVGKASIRSLQNRSECTIRLQPEFLGNVRMTVTTLNEQVTIQIVTDKAFAKDSIESNLHLLKAELNNHGLTIDKFDVSSIADVDQHSGRDQFAQTSKDHLSQNGRNQTEDQEPEKDGRQKGKNRQEEEPRRDKRRQEYLKQNGISQFV